jgi:hypothetical protein
VADDNYRIERLMKEIVKSVPFRMRRGEVGHNRVASKQVTK